MGLTVCLCGIQELYEQLEDVEQAKQELEEHMEKKEAAKKEPQYKASSGTPQEAVAAPSVVKTEVPLVGKRSLEASTNPNLDGLYWKVPAASACGETTLSTPSHGRPVRARHTPQVTNMIIYDILRICPYQLYLLSPGLCREASAATKGARDRASPGPNSRMKLNQARATRPTEQTVLNVLLVCRRRMSARRHCTVAPLLD